MTGEVITYFHTTTFSAGTYFALPLGTLQSTFVVFRGVGMRITTFVAESLLLKLVLTVITYDTWVVPISLTVGMTRKGSFTFDVERYLSKVGAAVRINDEGCGSDLLHEFEFTIGRNKADSSGRIKFIQAHALMKSAVV